MRFQILGFEGVGVVDEVFLDFCVASFQILDCKGSESGGWRV